MVRPADIILSYFGFGRGPTDGPPLFAIDLAATVEERVLSEDLQPLAREWFGCRISAGSEMAVVVRGRSRLVIDKRAGKASLQLDAGEGVEARDSKETLFLMLMFALVHALQAHGRYILHGAAVCDDDGSGMLIIGESDTGKSTLTMSLVQQGWGYLSDDSLVLTESGDGISVEPFRTDFGLDPAAEELFPGISGEAEPWLFGGEKWRVRIHRLYPDQARAECRPRMLVFPEIDPAAESRLETVKSADAMVRVMHQGSFLFSGEERRDARRQIDLFGRLIGQCGLYKLVAGPEIVRNAELLSSAFGPRLVGTAGATQSKAGLSKS